MVAFAKHARDAWRKKRLRHWFFVDCHTSTGPTAKKVRLSTQVMSGMNSDENP
jgi:hypothetical protein